MRVNFWRLWVFNDPQWNPRTFDFDHDLAAGEQRSASSSIRGIRSAWVQTRGAVAIVYQGWQDPVVNPIDTIAYYEQVRCDKVRKRKPIASFVCSWCLGWDIAAAARVRPVSAIRAVQRRRSTPITISCARSTAGSRINAARSYRCVTGGRRTGDRERVRCAPIQNARSIRGLAAPTTPRTSCAGDTTRGFCRRRASARRSAGLKAGRNIDVKRRSR